MTHSIDIPEPAVDLAQLIGLFFPTGDDSDLGVFESVGSAAVPNPYGKLLDHHSHMTVAVESHFNSPVNVRVVRTKKDDTWYAREILLSTQDDHTIVQYGIVRIRFKMLSKPVWREIEAGLKPLGRVLIEHEVMRQVELVGLWRVACGPRLASHFSVKNHHLTYGRTARIFCDSEPAIELLEIVRPAE